MEQNQQQIPSEHHPELRREEYMRREEKGSVLPLINTIISGITLVIAVVILILSLTNPLSRMTMGGVQRIEGMPIEGMPFGSQGLEPGTAEPSR